jgi:plastocyanin
MARNVIVMGKKITLPKITVCIIFSVVLSLLFLSGCTQQPNNPELNTVLMENSLFNPGTLTITNGTTVTWINNDDVDHNVVSEDGLFSSGVLSKGQTFTYTFTLQGTYDYSCSIHPSMRGTIIVL